MICRINLNVTKLFSKSTIHFIRITFCLNVGFDGYLSYITLLVLENFIIYGTLLLAYMVNLLTMRIYKGHQQGRLYSPKTNEGV